MDRQKKLQLKSLAGVRSLAGLFFYSGKDRSCLFIGKLEGET